MQIKQVFTDGAWTVEVDGWYGWEARFIFHGIL